MVRALCQKLLLDHISWQFQPCPSNSVIANKIHLLIRVFWPSSVSTVASSSSVKSKVLICFQYTIKQTFYYHSIPNTCSTKLFNIGPFHTGEKVVYYGKIFCHHQHFISVDGLCWIDKFWPKWTNLYKHYWQNMNHY